MTRIRLEAVAALGATASLLGLGARFLGAWRAPFSGGAALSGILVIAGYLWVSAAFQRSNAAFFGAFVGGTLARLAVLVGSVWAVHARGPWAAAPFAVGAAAGLVLTSFVELYFLQAQNRWISSTRSNTTSSTTSTAA